jgi:hypothetical protein
MSNSWRRSPKILIDIVNIQNVFISRIAHVYHYSCLIHFVKNGIYCTLYYILKALGHSVEIGK